MPEQPTAQASGFARLFRRIILDHPLAVVLLYLAGTLFFAYHIRHFRLDASSDSLVLENDADLKYYEETRELFGSDDYVVVAVTPAAGPVIQDAVIDDLHSLSTSLERVPNVETVDSILTVPLFASPKVALVDMGTKFKTLRMPDADRSAADRELRNSPLWRNNLVSADGRTAAIVLTFRGDAVFKKLSDERYELRRKRASGTLSAAETARLREVSRAYSARHAEQSAQRRKDIAEIRKLLADYRARGYDVAESGVPMIVADMVSYIERDIIVFGVGVLAFLTLVLILLFRQVRWVLLPLATCLIPVVWLMGYLGLASWEITVVSSNFSSLLLIVVMENAIYLIVRFREIHARFRDMDTGDVLFQTVREIAVPCLYTTATTVGGFATLVISGIMPVIDFGELMAAGISLAYVVNFTFFPAAIMLFPKGAPPPQQLAELERSPVGFLADFSLRRRVPIIAGSAVLLVLSLYGMTKLQVENRFIDYFKKNTPIAKGLSAIDNRLGGTISLEVVLDGGKPDYWIEPQNLAVLRRVHQFVETLPDVGKVISLDTMIQILTSVNDGASPNRFVLNIARASLSKKTKEAVLLPYVTADFSQARIFVRIRESSPTLSRELILSRLRAFLRDDVKLGEDRARVTGLFVLYNNLLRSLFDSQINTLGSVIVVIYVMLVALFRSPYLCAISMVPIVLPILMILGTMGLAGISLDMMTIMVASVTMGIADDNMIQYAFRHRDEFREHGSYKIATTRTHNSIGVAILYSNLTIVAGFAILMLSNFIPTIYFGLFTSLAMAAGFLGSLTLLPMLLAALRAHGRERPSAARSEGR